MTAVTGWQVSGVERSRWAGERAAARLGVTVAPTLAELPPDVTELSAITFFQVLEHMPAPDEALAAAHERLAAGGVLVIETWDADSRIARVTGSHWQQVNPPSVLYLTNRRGLTAMLERAGFDVRAIRATSKLVSVGLVLGLLADRYRALAPLFRRLQGGWVGRLALPYRLGDLVTVSAVRRSR